MTATDSASPAPMPLRGPRRALRRIREIMAGAGQAQERLNQVATVIAEELDADVASIYLIRDGGALELSATHGLKSEAVHKTRLKAGEGLAGLVARTARPVSVENGPDHPNFSYKPETGEEPFKGFLGAPILRGGRLVGVATAQLVEARRMGEAEIETLQTIALLLGEIVVSGDLVKAEGFTGLELRPTKPERFQGVSLSPGLVVGQAVLQEPHVAPARMVADDARLEEARLEGAIARLRASVDDLLDATRFRLGATSREVLEAYRMYAYDQGWLRNLREAVRLGLTAEAAVERVRNEHRARLMKARDPNFRERLHDLEDLANRLLRHLAGDGGAPVDLPENAVLIARSVGPAELLDYDRTRLKGVAVEEGSASSHAAIVAKALGLPMVGQVEGALDRIEDGDPIILDGEFALLHARPSEEARQAYRARAESLRARRQAYAKAKDEPAVTADGVEMSLHLNAGLIVELTQLEETGAQGVGLFRTEFQFMVADALPRLSAQIDLYRAVLNAAGDKPVVFRTLDLGGDKAAPYTPYVREPNPAMGWRALRIGLDRPGLTRYQLRALVRAAGGRDLHVMFPLVAAPEEFAVAKALLHAECEIAQRRGYDPPRAVRVGLMIETPAVAYDPDPVFALADFAALGANDLMQFWFAADRQNPRVAGRYDLLSPGPIRLLKNLQAAAERWGKPLSVCGEVAGKPLEACVLTALGYRRLSMAASNIGPVKTALSTLHAGKLADWLQEAITAPPDVAKGGLRAQLLHLRESAGLPLETVDNAERV